MGSGDWHFGLGNGWCFVYHNIEWTQIQNETSQCYHHVFSHHEHPYSKSTGGIGKKIRGCHSIENRSVCRQDLFLRRSFEGNVYLSPYTIQDWLPYIWQHTNEVPRKGFSIDLTWTARKKQEGKERTTLLPPKPDTSTPGEGFPPPYPSTPLRIKGPVTTLPRREGLDLVRMPENELVPYLKENKFENNKHMWNNDNNNERRIILQLITPKFSEQFFFFFVVNSPGIGQGVGMCCLKRQRRV